MSGLGKFSVYSGFGLDRFTVYLINHDSADTCSNREYNLNTAHCTFNPQQKLLYNYFLGRSISRSIQKGKGTLITKTDDIIYSDGDHRNKILAMKSKIHKKHSLLSPEKGSIENTL